MINLVNKKMEKHKFKSTAGYSLIEVLVVVSLMGVALTLAVPGMTAFTYRQRLNTANREIYQALRAAQGEGIRRKQVWQVSLRKNTNGVVQWAKHNESTSLGSLVWHDLDKNIQIDEANTRSTEVEGGVWTIGFDHNGHVVDPNKEMEQGNLIPQFTLMLAKYVDKNNEFSRRCVSIETIVGAMRVQKDNYCKK